ncbi:probable serine/threonine-protein kinase PBL2 [Vigna radiata var. radiata]|uniref:Probable serine/threonine-protein kinase PBL2 n=1 Tax=Vigna radiata var. radiata TaxID=3916 RepID=A0A3Q0ER93_VIGRR|nr:probable serine/threonine-protein kinase PBL2 [Vigna radiata var. radiata]
MMSEESLSIVVIHYASRDFNTRAIKVVMQGFSLGRGDKLTLLVILRQAHSPSRLPFIAPAKLLGLFETDHKIVEEEVAKKKEELLNNASLREISELCEADRIQFRVEVLQGKLPEVAVNAAIRLEATSVIIDRQMKKYKKEFKQSLFCSLLIMKRDNSVQHLRGPRETHLCDGSNGNARCVRCPISKSPRRVRQVTNSCSNTSSSFPTLAKGGCPQPQFYSQIKQIPENRVEDMERGYCLLSITDTQKTNHTEEYYIETPAEHSNNPEAYQIVEQFKNSVCSVCKNRRPKFEVMKEFTYAELHEATQGFSPKNYLSEGGFGSVYKGRLQGGLRIAVKQHKCASLQGEKEFKSEVNALSRAIHENVVMLRGSCSEGNNRLLVYEFICNGSLDQHLSQHSRRPLTWKERIKVAIGAARGLLYLHQNNIIHRDMRPSNILVTHDYEAMLGDFGLARTEQMDSLYSTDVVGTIGYLAPEYAESGKLSTKTDVYAFGVVLLQLITGMRTADKRLGEKSLVGWARPLLKERNYPDLIDERMLDNHDCHQLFWMIRLAEKCLSRDSQRRLSMDTVVNALTHILEGNTCSVVLRDCSPAQSDSSYDMSDLLISDTSQEIVCEDTSNYAGYASMCFRPPPSPPLGSTSSSTSSVFTGLSESPIDDLSNNKNKGKRANEQGGIL